MDQRQQLRLAHQFNEELTIILNTAAVIARLLLGPGHPVSHAVVELKRSAMRCAELARKLARQ